MSPWLVLGFFAASIVKYLLKDSWIQKYLGSPGWKGAVAATLWGIPLPLCSCSVLPVAMVFRNKGASPESTISFLTSTPQTGVDSIFATAGILGLPIACLRVLSAFVSGILSGKFAGGLGTETYKLSAEPENEESCCSGKSGTSEQKKNSLLASLFYGFWKIPKELNKALLVGLVIGAGLTQLGSLEGVQEWFRVPIKGYLVAALLAIPIYTCSTGSIPMAIGLAALGASPGATMIFLILGPATNIITITSIGKIIGRKATLLYLFIVATTAFSTGIFTDVLGLGIQANQQMVHSHHDTHWLKLLLTSILLGILILTFLPLSRLKKKKSDDSENCCQGS